MIFLSPEFITYYTKKITMFINPNNDSSDDEQYPETETLSQTQAINEIDNTYKDGNVPTCRFCLEEDQEDKFIQPCLCDGSSKWVHRYV